MGEKLVDDLLELTIQVHIAPPRNEVKKVRGDLSKEETRPTPEIFLSRACQTFDFMPARSSAATASRQKKKRRSSRLFFDSLQERVVYFSSTSSPTSIRRKEFMIRPIAQRSPTARTAISPR